MKCLIMAGGFDARPYPSPPVKAKTLITHKGKSLLTHLVEKVPRGIDIMVSVNKRFEQEFRKWLLATHIHAELLMEGSPANARWTGAVSALNMWIRQMAIRDDLLVIGGDNYFEFDLRDFIAASDRVSTLVAVSDIGDVEKAAQFGVVKLADSKIVEFAEKPRGAATSLIAAACYVFPRRVFPLLERYCSEGMQDNLGSFIAHLVAVDEVRAFVFKEQWFDIGSGLLSPPDENTAPDISKTTGYLL